MSERTDISSRPEFGGEAPPMGSPYELRLSQGARASESDIRMALESGELGFVHSFTTGSAVDGPGLRIVAWLTGCQFKCVYCHNPDTWKMTNGMPVKLARAIEVVRQYRHGLGVMKGGLTISGGEPLLQHRFVLKVFAAAKTLGVHTALDTNGYLGDREENFGFWPGCSGWGLARVCLCCCPGNLPVPQTPRPAASPACLPR